MDADIVLEPMAEADLEAVLAIERGSFPNPWSGGMFRHELTLPFSHLRVARRAVDRAVVGYVCWWEVGDELHILNLAVAPAWRRRGIGRRLVEAVLRAARERSAAVVTLEVREENTAARRLYEGLGFRPAGLRKDYYGRGRHAVVMSLDVPQSAPPGPGGPDGSP